MCAFVFELISINSYVTAAILDKKTGSTVTATVFIRFSSNFVCDISSVLLGLELNFCNLRHHLLVKMMLKKPLKPEVT